MTFTWEGIFVEVTYEPAPDTMRVYLFDERAVDQGVARDMVMHLPLRWPEINPTVEEEVLGRHIKSIMPALATLLLAYRPDATSINPSAKAMVATLVQEQS